MAHYFVTGIGTEVGKTFSTCALLHQNPHYQAIKPVLSGYDAAEPEASDAGALLVAMGETRSQENLNNVSPWRFKAPLSPHLAAQKENTAIDTEALLAFCRKQMDENPDLLIEGVGDLMAPITPQWLVLDWIKALNLPVILVASSYLGAINHTLLSLEALKSADICVQAVLLSQCEPENDAGMEDTAQSIRPFMAADIPLLTLPRVQAADSSWKQAPSLLSVLT